MRFAIGVEYDGSDFSGWERQPGRRTIQAAVEDALSRVADERVRTICAGRTDARVHALCQVVHFDTRARREVHAWMMGANANLPEDVSVLWARPVDDEFHARYSARRRHYRYVVLNRRTRPAVWRRRAAWAYRALDASRMQAGADYLVGEHDFSAFRGAGCQSRSPRRDVQRLEVVRHGSFVVIDVVANAFLQHMVRNMAGVLLGIGEGRHEPVWAREVLDARDRTRGGVTAPPEGLYLTRVDYAPELALPVVSPHGALW